MQAKVNPLSTLLRFVFVGFGGEPFSTADDEGSDEAAVDDTGGFAEYYFNFGILLVQDIDATDRLLLGNQGFNGLFVAVQGDAENGCVPLLAKVIGHLRHYEGFAYLVNSFDALNTTFFVTGDLMNYFCHIKVFRQK